ncbi:NAD(P)-binding protein [Coniochaeta hoffmannii]|uniref:NAD(P)-binding protein n=1 Tax=Coniochaeta hoffmannii TaxID=91930 RepID=A0AA38RHV4_9PEZI|nr:NAD(P)-binding protein [Coniochaeta hoffmannii]
MSPRAILVTGATGRQGGAVVRHLQGNPEFQILAVTRNPDSHAAQRLSQQAPNITVVQGNLNDVEALFESAKKLADGPVWGVYSMQNPLAKGESIELEEQQGKALVDAALKSGVQHFVYSSVDRGGDDKSFDNPTPVPYWVSKHAIEHHLVDRASGGEMGWTILRPASFMDDFVPGFRAKFLFTAWKLSLAPGKRMQLAAVTDVGHFAARAFMFPKQYSGRGISIAGDELTYDEAAAVFRQKTGRDVPTMFGFAASLLLRVIPGVGAMFKWLAEEGFQANIGELRKEHPGLMDFPTFIEKHSGYLP